MCIFISNLTHRTLVEEFYGHVVVGRSSTPWSPVAVGGRLSVDGQEVVAIVAVQVAYSIVDSSSVASAIPGRPSSIIAPIAPVAIAVAIAVIVAVDSCSISSSPSSSSETDDTNAITAAPVVVVVIVAVVAVAVAVAAVASSPPISSRLAATISDCSSFSPIGVVPPGRAEAVPGSPVDVSSHVAVGVAASSVKGAATARGAVADSVVCES